MPAMQLDRLRLPHRRHYSYSRWWRNWCFLKAVVRSFGLRLLIIAAILATGAVLFLVFYEPKPGDAELSPVKAVFYTWSLVFGQPPEGFPTQPVLQALHFIIPILGLTTIIEGIVDFSLMLRDRRRSETSWCKTMAASLSDH